MDQADINDYHMAPVVDGTLARPFTLDEWEAQHIAFVLRWCGGVRRQAAAQLGLARSTLLAKIRRYELEDVGKEPVTATAAR